MAKNKLKIEVNNVQNIQDLLQEAYFLADEQIIQVQNEINKMANATQLQEESIEGKGKYGKIINDYLAIKDKAIAKKIDIAKVMTDIYHHAASSSDGLEGSSVAKGMTLNLDDIRKMVDDSFKENETTTKKIDLGKE